MKKSANTCPTCGAHLLFPPPMHKTIKALIKDWIDGLELEGRSYAHLRKLRSITRDYILLHFKGYDVRAIRTVDVQDFYHTLLKKPLASKTVKHILDTLRAFMHRMYALEVIDTLPRFPSVKVRPAREKRWISAEAQSRVLNAIAPEHRLLFRVLFETGCRPSEVCALKVKDLRDEGVYVCRAFDERGYVKDTKTGAEYLRPISSALYEQLNAAVRRVFPETFLFRDGGETYNSKKLYYLWTCACRRVGVRISLYEGVRHSRASQRRKELEAALREELRKELEHTSPRTTLKHYALGADKEVQT